MDLYDQLQANVSPGNSFELDQAIALPENLSTKLIAYYLPQFHAVPENDKWWGRGFTEWTNVTKAIPKFPGHYQPHLPIDLGFYDLSRVDVLQRQAAIAKGYGLHGFCFHYYWFGGRKILETPINNLLATPDLNLPFCVNWANENWTRRWDGKEKDVLLGQSYSEQDDYALATDLASLVRDPRYITVSGRPLIMIYRPKLLPDARVTIERWRKVFASEGLPDPYLIMPQNDDDRDPRTYGFDAAAGFPPHACMNEAKAQQATREDPRLRPERLFDKSFSGKIFEYEDIAAAALSNDTDEYRLIPGIIPSWDNDARRSGRGVTIVGSSPAAYGRWLREACAATKRFADQDERMVFVNAWNEWGEGAHLEPDRHFGYAYLAETARVLAGVDAKADSPQTPRPRAAAPKPKFGMGLGLRARTAGILETLADRIR